MTWLSRFFGFTGLCLWLSTTAQADQIQPYAGNPAYWAYKQKPVMLLGTSRTHNLFQSPDIERELEEIRSFGGNYVRNTMSVREEGDIFPYVKTGKGFDLEQFNPAYWEKFEALLSAAAARDIIVQVEIWDIWDFQRESWLKHPFNPVNSIDYSEEQLPLPRTLDQHPIKVQNPFFSTVLEPERFAWLLERQTEFVRKLLDISLKYDNVLYVVDNESFVSAQWGEHWAKLVRAEAEQRGVQVYLSEMWEPHNIQNPKHLLTIDRPDLYDFVETSQNNHVPGQRHHDRAAWVAERIGASPSPRPINNIKIYGSATSPFVDGDVAISSFWKSLLAGHASVRFHREPSGMGLMPPARNNVNTARALFSRFDFVASRRCTTDLQAREEDEAYCLRNDRQVLIYFPMRKKQYNFNTWTKLDRRWNLSRFLVDNASVTLPATAGKKATWFNPTTGASQGGGLESDNITAPSNEHWVVLIEE